MPAKPLPAPRTPPHVLQQIHRARDEGVERLDLSGGYMRALGHFPEACLELTQLKRLDVRNNGIRQLPAGLAELKELEWLDIRRNPIRELPAVPLPPLVIDSLQWERLGAQLKGRRIVGFQVVRASETSLEELLNLPFLEDCELLNLSGLGLSAIPERVLELANLTLLDLGHDQLSALPEGLSQLARLSSLYLYGNQFSALPEELSSLVNLTSLDLRGNQLSDLPEDLSPLANLSS